MLLSNDIVTQLKTNESVDLSTESIDYGALKDIFVYAENNHNLVSINLSNLVIPENQFNEKIMPKILQHPSLIKVTLPPSYTNSDELMLGLDDKARAIQATKEAMQLLDDIKKMLQKFPDYLQQTTIKEQLVNHKKRWGSLQKTLLRWSENYPWSHNYHQEVKNKHSATLATLHNLKLPLPTEYTEATNYENIQLQLNANKPKKEPTQETSQNGKSDKKINFSDFLIHYEAMKMYETEDTLFIENFRHNKPSHQAELTQKISLFKTHNHIVFYNSLVTEEEIQKTIGSSTSQAKIQHLHLSHSVLDETDMEQEQALQNSPIQLDTIYLENSLATTPKLSSLVIALQSKEIHADLESIVENKLLLIDNIAIVLHHQNKEISFNIAQLNELEKYVIEDLLNFLAKAEKLMDRFASEKAHIDYQQTVGPLLAFLESMTEKKAELTKLNQNNKKLSIPLLIAKTKFSLALEIYEKMGIKFYKKDNSKEFLITTFIDYAKIALHSIYTTAATDAYQCLVNLYKDIEKLQKLKILNKSLNSTLMACHIGCKTLVLDNKNQLSIKDRINIIKLIPLGCINLTSNESSNFELSKELSRNDILLEMLQQQLPKELLALTDDSGKKRLQGIFDEIENADSLEVIATALNKTKGKLNFLIPAIDKKQQKIINFSKEIHMEILPFINKDVLENDNQL